MIDQILSYREMCDAENVQVLQKGMSFRLRPSYSVILMSRRSNAPYQDKVREDGITIEYEGHDEPQFIGKPDVKNLDQPRFTLHGKLTQNGKFAEAVESYKKGEKEAELVKVYEKIFSGVWSLKGYFKLIDYKFKSNGKRKVFIFILKLSDHQSEIMTETIDLKHTRLISSEIKRIVWKRDQGKCVLCGETKNIHYDHDLPFSKGGTSLTEKNIRLLCAKCNLAKSDKIE